MALVELRGNERKILLALEERHGKGSAQDIADTAGLDIAAVMRNALQLSARGLILAEDRRRSITRLTDEGASYSSAGLPERRMLMALIAAGGRAPLADIARSALIPASMVPIALGWLRTKGWASVEKSGNNLLLVAGAIPPQEGPDEELLQLLAERKAVRVDQLGTLADVLNTLTRRKLVEMSEEVERDLILTEAGGNALREGISLEEGVSSLTHQLLASGAWRSVQLRGYDIRAPVAPTWPGKAQPYVEFLSDLKQRLVGLGFKEMRGPLVELAFYNCDALYMPQDHPAREIHDIYYVREPSSGEIDVPKTLERVRRTHEGGWITGSRGWGYAYSLSEARRLVLRSHNTPVSARMLLNKDLEIPGKYYSVARCFRPDVVDRTHLTEFNQAEGIVLGEGLCLKDLLGILATFAVEIAGATKFRFVPDYFPFTEPSIELNAYKEGYGWIEFGGSGIFRPELTKPLGIKVPVLAWGLGADRLYMMKAKIDDIRTMFTQDLEYLRKKEVL
jgi:phenylalanyl-tRNA synthetase alpha chain